jgi:Transposase
VARRGADHLTDRAWDRLLTGLAAGDVDQQIAQAWIAAQDLRLIYRSTDRAQAQERLYRWFCCCADTDIPELHRLARTIDAWRCSSWPTSTPVGSPTGPPRRSTCSSSRHGPAGPVPLGSWVTHADGRSHNRRRPAAMSSVSRSRAPIHVGLDVHKDSISVAVLRRADDDATEVVKILSDEGSVRHYFARFEDLSRLRVCYEAGPTGYELHRLLTHLGVRCEVIAPRRP